MTRFPTSLACLLYIMFGVIIGVAAYHIGHSNQYHWEPAFNIQREYATTKVTSKLCEIEKYQLKNAKEWWEKEGYKANIYLGPLDWHQNQIPKKMCIIFTDLPEDWGVQVDDQYPMGEQDRPPAHLYIGNKPTNEFDMEIGNPTAAYKWRVILYPKTKDADPNFQPEDVRVHFDWKVQRIKK